MLPVVVILTVLANGMPLVTGNETMSLAQTQSTSVTVSHTPPQTTQFLLLERPRYCRNGHYYCCDDNVLNDCAYDYRWFGGTVTFFVFALVVVAIFLCFWCPFIESESCQHRPISKTSTSSNDGKNARGPGVPEDSNEPNDPKDLNTAHYMLLHL